MRRVVIFGTTGSGKSRLAEALAARTGLRAIELDALFWGRDWQSAPVELFRHRVACALAPLPEEGPGDGWIVTGIYGQVRDLTWGAADTLVWLDLPFPLVFWRLLRRTVRRTVTQEDLWGTGNRESFVRSFFSRQSILLWAIETHRRNRVRFTADCARYGEGRTVVRLRSRREIAAFLAAR